MAFNRVTFFFQSDDYGWSESLFRPDGENLTESANLGVLLGQARVGMLCRPAVLKFVRASVEGIFRDSLVVPMGEAGNPAGARFDLGLEDIPNTCLNVRFENAATPTRRAVFQLRGIPDSIVVNGGKFEDNADFTRAFQRWVNVLRQGIVGRWCFRAHVPLTDPPTLVQVTNVAQGDLGTAIVTTATPHGLAVGNIAIIRAKRQWKGLKGRRPVIATVDANHFIVPTKLQVSPSAFNCTVEKFNPQPTPIGAVLIRSVSHRITGRPSDSPHGRRRVQSVA